MKTPKTILFLMLMILLYTSVSYGHDLVWPGEKLKALFPRAESFEQKNLYVSDEQRKNIEDALGSKLPEEDLRPSIYLAIVRSGWINLSENISIKEGVEREILPEADKGYSVNVKLFPDKVYADHVVTFLYEISYNGAPVKYPEKMEGADILLSSWDKSRKEFICAGSRQNVDGKIAAGIVFMRPGKHKVFAEFKHNGAVRVFAHEIEILEEPAQREHGLF